MIPLVHDLADETALVVGGGPVGARKARRFARETTTVVCAPAFAERDFGAADRVRLRLRPADAADWVARVDPALVVTATDDAALNDAVATAARERGALVNRADRAGERAADSVVVPATVEDGPVTVAVTTDGTSPALSRYLREEIESHLAGAGAMAELSADVRADLKRRGVDPETRREAVRAVVRSRAVWKGLRGGSGKPERDVAEVVTEVLSDR